VLSDVLIITRRITGASSSAINPVELINNEICSNRFNPRAVSPVFVYKVKMGK
jgi:hypothetical protein